MAKYYLAYGSNLSVGQMLQRCPNAIYVGQTKLYDYKLMFRGSKTGSYLTIEEAKGYTVPCVVWKVSESDEENLDYYEGYPTFYSKQTMDVTVYGFIDGMEGDAVRTVEAFVYAMGKGHRAGVPSRRYWDVCKEGYRRFGFDLKILKKALEESEMEEFFDWRGRRA